MAQRGRETNAIINNIGHVHFACSEEVSCPMCKNVNLVCVSKLLSTKSNVNLEFNLYVSNSFFETSSLKNIYDL